MLVVILVAFTIIVAAVTIIEPAVMIIVEPLLMVIVVVALVAIRIGNPFSFLGVDVLVCYMYQFADGRGPLAV